MGSWYYLKCGLALLELFCDGLRNNHKDGQLFPSSWKTAENHNLGTRASRVQAGKDLFGRADQSYTRIERNTDIPFYISEQNQLKGKLGYLLDRDGESAGFQDYTADDGKPVSERSYVVGMEDSPGRVLLRGAKHG